MKVFDTTVFKNQIDVSVDMMDLRPSKIIITDKKDVIYIKYFHRNILYYIIIIILRQALKSMQFYR